MPKFGEWDVNDPASAEGFTVIFNKARNEKRTGGKPESPPKNASTSEDNGHETLGKNQHVSLSELIILKTFFLQVSNILFEIMMIAKNFLCACKFYCFMNRIGLKVLAFFKILF